MKKYIFIISLFLSLVFWINNPAKAEFNFDENYYLGRALALANLKSDENYESYEIKILHFWQRGEEGSVLDPTEKTINLIPSGLGLGSIQIKLTAPTYEIEDGPNKISFTTFKRGVRGILDEAGIILAKEDRVEPSPNQIAKDKKIKITRVMESEIEEFETLPYQTKEILDPNLERGLTRIDQAGSSGKRRLLYFVRRENGIEVNKNLISDEVVEKPENKIIRIGTKIVVLSSISGEASWTKGITAMREYRRGTLIRVTNLANGKSVETRVEGWGPQSYTGRILDLAENEFEKIADLGSGTTNVLVEELKE